jgi:hypothetical protein
MTMTERKKRRKRKIKEEYDKKNKINKIKKKRKRKIRIVEKRRELEKREDLNPFFFFLLTQLDSEQHSN